MMLKTYLYLILLLSITACSSPLQQAEAKKTTGKAAFSPQIAQYVVNIFEDSQGKLWFGTVGEGVACYDGNRLKYYSTVDGLGSNSVIDFSEEEDGTLWIATHNGLAKFDGEKFTNYNEQDGLCHYRTNKFLVDSKDRFWIGTWDGVCLFDGTSFTPFPIPFPEVDGFLNPDTQNWVTEIMEDQYGNIWFGRDGYGAARYDGDSFTHFTKKDGLTSNNVQDITEDDEGNIWIGTRVAEKDHPDPSKRFGPGGAHLYDGKTFRQFPLLEGLTDNDVYSIYNDGVGGIWISTIGSGVYRYADGAFTHHEIKDPVSGGSKAIMGLLRDSKGKMWVGSNDGLYRLDAGGAVNVTRAGPWN